MDVFLVVNGYEVEAEVAEQEEVILRLASGEMDREDFTDWVRSHVIKVQQCVLLCSFDTLFGFLG